MLVEKDSGLVEGAPSRRQTEGGAFFHHGNPLSWHYY